MMLPPTNNETVILYNISTDNFLVYTQTPKDEIKYSQRKFIRLFSNAKQSFFRILNEI